MRNEQGHRKKSRLLVEELEQRLVLSTYYVATTGNNNNPGSSTAPFATLQQAANTVQAGDTVIVEAGKYAGFIMGWDSPTAGTSFVPITFKADPTAAAGSVIINSPDQYTSCGIDLEPGCNWITVEGFTIEGGNGITTTSKSGYGIKVTGSNDSVIDNTVTGLVNGTAGIEANNAPNALIKGNTITDIHGQGNPDEGHGIYLCGDSPDAVITGNVIDNNDYIGIHINNDGTVGDLTGALIAGNLIYNNGQNGINADGILNSTIENNVIYGYASYGICLYQIDSASPSTGNVIVNNTIVSTDAGAGAAVRILDGGTNNTVLNNILLGGGGIALRISSDSQSGLVSDCNVSGGTYQNDDSGSTQSLASWQSATGQDKHSFTATAAAPSVNAAGNDYHLSSTSPALGTGTSTDAPATDFDGNARPQSNGYDIGAYELVVSGGSGGSGGSTGGSGGGSTGGGSTGGSGGSTGGSGGGSTGGGSTGGSGGGQGSLSAPPSGSASVAFGPAGEVMVIVSSDGLLRQFDAAGVHVLGGGVRSASVAFGPAGEELLITLQNGALMQFDATVAHFLGNGVLSASLGFGPGGEVVEVVSLDGTLRQIDATGVHVLGGGVQSASVAFGPLGEVLDVTSQDGQLVQFDATGSHTLGGDVLFAGLAYGPMGPVMDLVFLDGSLVLIDAFGVHHLGMV